METNNFCNEKFLEEYDNFLNQLVNIFDEKEIINNFQNECPSDKLSRGTKFYNSLDKDEIFDLFAKSKVKLFSAKSEETILVSESLFGKDLPLKKLVNNQSEETKDIFWKYFHLFYFLLESNNKNRDDRKKIISKLLKEKTEKINERVKNKLLDVDLNHDTNDMIDDIVSSFENCLENKEGNPFESIMDITNTITEKYSNKIQSGDIEIEKIIGSIQNSIPGMPDIAKMATGGTKEEKETVVIDENFSTEQVELGDKDKKDSGMNLSNMMKMMNSMKGGMPGMEGIPGMEGKGMPDFGSVFSVLGKMKDIETQEDADKLKDEMDNFLQNQLGVDMNKFTEQFEKSHLKGLNSLNEDNNDSENEPDID